MKKKFSRRCIVLINRWLVCVIFFNFFLISFPLSAFDEKNRVNLEQDSLRVVKFYQNGVLALQLGDFEVAVRNFGLGVSFGKKVFGEHNKRISSFLISLGISYKNLGEYDKAIDSYLEAEKLIIDLYSDDNPRLAYVYVNLGTIYKLRGDYVKNYEFQQAALRVSLTKPSDQKNQIEITEYNISEAMFLLGNYEQAISSCLQNITDVSDVSKSFYYGLLARIYKELGDQELTKEYYQKTFEILTKLKGEESYDLGLEYTNYSSFLLSSGKFEEVWRYAQLSEKMVANYFTKKSLQYCDVMLNFADYFFLRSSEASLLDDFQSKRKADLSKALEYYQKALVAGTSNFSATDFSQNPEVGQEISEIQILEVLKKKAACLQTLADIQSSAPDQADVRANYEVALQTIDRATGLIHQIRTGYVSEDSKFFLAENQESTFIDAVNISYKLYQQTGDPVYAERGFEFAEKSKSASFLAAVKDSKAKEFGGIPDRLTKREDYLKMNISNYKEMLFEENQNSEPDPERTALFNSKIFQLTEQYEQLIAVLEDSFPNYYSFKYENKVVGVEDIRDKISEKTAVVEYLIDEPGGVTKKGRVFKFVITNDKFHFSKTEVDYSFVAAIESVYRFLTSSSYLFTGLEDFKGYSTSAFRLYDVLLQDEKKLLGGKELVIIPDDKLAYIPFDALLSQMPDTSRMNFRNLSYLVKDYSISYTYSATLLFDYFRKKKVAGKDLLAFAPSYIGDERDYTANAEFRAGLLPLPAVNKEVDFINGYVKGDVFKDSLAQEGRFKELAPDYDILHLAMHTIINDSLPMYSKLAFSRPYSGEKDDGWLITNEVYTMELKARMAVLSACNTGSGKLQKGEGVMSLARGFLYAGCPSIVMTLWEVEDESGAHIMKDFYRFLSKGKSKNEALRAAKLAHIDQADPLKAHPHYWLGYVVVGNSEALYHSKDIHFVLAILGLIVLLFMDQVYRKKKARH